MICLSPQGFSRDYDIVIFICDDKYFMELHFFLFGILQILNSVRVEIKVANLKKICSPLSINFQEPANAKPN